jgi:hypothetical protein
MKEAIKRKFQMTQTSLSIPLLGLSDVPICPVNTADSLESHLCDLIALQVIATSMDVDLVSKKWSTNADYETGEGSLSLSIFKGKFTQDEETGRIDPVLNVDHELTLIAQVPGYLTGAAVRRFLARERSVWVSASAWEGVSLPGAISHIVVPRLPIRPLNFEDSVVQAYVNETYGAGGRSVIFGRQMADARRRLRQGVGRGVRSHEDRVTIWIGDPRWPLTQREADELLMDQPRAWSSTMANAISARFRRKIKTSPRFEGGLGQKRYDP